MHPHVIDRAVAAATGESIHTIRQRGFSLADPLCDRYDPEPYDDRAPAPLPRDAARLGFPGAEAGA